MWNKRNWKFQLGPCQPPRQHSTSVAGQHQQSSMAIGEARGRKGDDGYLKIWTIPISSQINPNGLNMNMYDSTTYRNVKGHSSFSGWVFSNLLQNQSTNSLRRWPSFGLWSSECGDWYHIPKVLECPSPGIEKFPGWRRIFDNFQYLMVIWMHLRNLM